MSIVRYVDAIREFNKILLYILKYKQYHQKSPQYDQILKKNEQMYALLAVCLSLCPQTKLVDENVSTQLKEKYNDKMTKMQRYDDEASTVYDELFSYGCPKFITPSAPVLDEPLTNYNQVNRCIEDKIPFAYAQLFCTRTVKRYKKMVHFAIADRCVLSLNSFSKFLMLSQPF